MRATIAACRVQEAREPERLRVLLARAKQYTDSLPQHRMLQDASGVFARDLQQRAAETR